MRQAIGQDGVGEQGAVDVAGQRAPAFTGQSDKVVGTRGRVRKARAMFLEKGAAAGGGGQHALEAQMEPLLIGEFGAGPGVGTGGDARGLSAIVSFV